MLAAQVLGCVLVLGWGSGLEGLPVLSEALFTTQENFNLSRVLGVWHEVAVVSTCPHAGHDKRDAAIDSLELKEGLEAGYLHVTKTMLTREGICKEISLDYELTTTPGRFYYNLTKRWPAEVDAYVVHTNYHEYAIIITSKQKSSGKPSISLKLYSRTMEVRDTVLADFKTLAKDLGMSNNTIIIKQDKGKCVPGEEASEELPQEFQSVQRKRRDVSPTAALVEEEGSGMAMPDFIDPASCRAEPDAGPCFGMKQRFFYNSSSMSCEEFQYGGCVGNQNNFVTERECLQRCRTEAVCRLPMAAQNCTGQPVVWAFDAQSGLCVAYKPGFCQGNGNKFYTKAECEEYCGAAKEEEELLQSN